MPPSDLDPYLESGEFVDSDDAGVVDFAKRVTDGAVDPVQIAVRLYYAVRDQVSYDPFYVGPEPTFFRASSCLENGRGFCVPKAALLAASARACGVPARVGYVDIRNHKAPVRFQARLDGSVFFWHGYVELYLKNSWVKSTPAFDFALSQRRRVPVLEFNGAEDSLLPEKDEHGNPWMTYMESHGVFSDVPYRTLLDVYQKRLPNWLYRHREREAYLKGSLDRDLVPPFRRRRRHE
jgi:transglutaminase-like putative cysteine protease